MAGMQVFAVAQVRPDLIQRRFPDLAYLPGCHADPDGCDPFRHYLRQVDHQWHGNPIAARDEGYTQTRFGARAFALSFKGRGV